MPASQRRLGPPLDETYYCPAVEFAPEMELALTFQCRGSELDDDID
jgi:hypothetical protein